MKKRSIWRDTDLWSQIGVLALPIVGFVALLLLAKPQLPEGFRGTASRNVRAPARVVIPESLPPDVLPKLATVNPQSLMRAVDRMAIETDQAVRASEGQTNIYVEVVKGVIPAPSSEPKAAASPLPRVRTNVFVSGLASPHGIARDPRTGNYFVADKQANRILLVTPRGRVRTVIDADTRLYLLDGQAQKRIVPLKSPEDLAMDRYGRLYVVEDHPKGRVLAIQISENGKVGPAEVIRVPGHATNFQWGAIAVRDNGELLLTGSSVEQAIGSGGFVQGALVYRDEKGAWWVPVSRPMAGFSSVAFSKNGAYAIYTDEITGTLGWIDLQSRYLREGASQTSFQKPEGVCILPDGRIAVAEEGGRVFIVDPELDHVQLLAEGLGAIESLLWDDNRQRFLVTADGQGQVIELIPDLTFDLAIDRMQRAVCHAEGAIRRVPPTAPDFLRPLLDLGGLSDLDPSFDLAFDELTRRVPMLATDARAILLHSNDEVPDPIVHLRFVALDPNRFRFDEPGFDFAISAVILRTRSGEIFKTQLSRTVIITGNLWLGEFKNHGTFDVPVPFAYHAQPGPRGHAVIHFTGLGRSPDISIALDPAKPDASFMIVTHLNGSVEQYRLETTRSSDGSENWVISLPARRPALWLNISDASSERGSEPRAR